MLPNILLNLLLGPNIGLSVCLVRDPTPWFGRISTKSVLSFGKTKSVEKARFISEIMEIELWF